MGMLASLPALHDRFSCAMQNSKPIAFTNPVERLGVCIRLALPEQIGL